MTVDALREGWRKSDVRAMDAASRVFSLEAERDAARAEVKRLKEALEEIERGHIPSMPMTEVVDELTWAQMWVGRLRKIARAALAQKDPQPHGN